MCTAAQVIVRFDTGYEAENGKRKINFEGKQKQRMAVITTIRC